MFFFRSIRFRLTLWYLVTLALILLLFSTFIYLTISKRLYAEVDRELLAIAEAVASPTLEPFRRSAPTVLDQILEDFIGPSVANKFVQIADASGKVFSSSTNLQNISLPLDKTSLIISGIGNSTYHTHSNSLRYPIRSITMPIMENGRMVQVVQVGMLLDYTSDILEKLLVIFAVSIPLALIMLWYAGWFLAGRALKPVELITTSARKISAENLGHRLEIINPSDEIGRLAKTFNITLDRLENAFNRTRQFSMDVSHELRTPLTILRGETEVGLRWGGDADELKKILRSNMEEINRMSDIIGDLLELSRAEEGKLVLDPVPVELHELLQDICTKAAPDAREKRIILDLPNAASLHVAGDPARLQQIFLNLIDNAIKYTPCDGKVSLAVDSEPGWAKVSVTDTGPGIPEADLPHIFEQFYRVDKARNRNDGGSGLGLSMVRAFSEAHGGRVEIFSLPGSGCTFTVFLPLSHH
ncbi:sensor histidine kinase, HAMP domain-containing [Geotalea daltonii FRC-32]|uniref:histidine kinase n=1 Tax=Geotalea daltonii (strain DSM 22248 / JCM 15807 / FRC-32) TaxID=316067 RepID=B9LZ45_GEODF|nr:ATP-binding protein [Geotalea daltonii]ACM18777.1 sensor histidine kinase, HAMP domain-containing [Geotalea daltonii FRC-32]